MILTWCKCDVGVCMQTDYDDDDDDEDEAPSKAAMAAPARKHSLPATNGTAIGKGAAGGLGGAGGKKDAAARQAEWRQNTLIHEAQVRMRFFVEPYNA